MGSRRFRDWISSHETALAIFSQRRLGFIQISAARSKRPSNSNKQHISTSQPKWQQTQSSPPKMIDLKRMNFSTGIIISDLHTINSFPFRVINQKTKRSHKTKHQISLHTWYDMGDMESTQGRHGKRYFAAQFRASIHAGHGPSTAAVTDGVKHLGWRKGCARAALFSSPAESWTLHGIMKDDEWDRLDRERPTFTRWEKRGHQQRQTYCTFRSWADKTSRMETRFCYRKARDADARKLASENNWPNQRRAFG